MSADVCSCGAVRTSQNLRLFVAADLPPDHLERLDAAVAPLRRLFDDGRWAPIENQHVTLKFLGSVPEERLEGVVEAGAGVTIANAPGTLSLGDLGTFPSTKRMRVLWVGLLDPVGMLAGLASQLDQVLEPLGFEPEKRAFTPHLTLARFKTPRRLDAPLPTVELPGEPFGLNELVLYRSHLSPRGARYEALQRWPLGAGGRTGAGSGEPLI
ncbi:MAG TPA: RNA 2',3'-cyclic phosphodiesterase [Actinomycetota bacterium]|nr:RNA 2',3'-cyclic phosphodiesterase [Actinomycetota bacterium]